MYEIVDGDLSFKDRVLGVYELKGEVDAEVGDEIILVEGGKIYSGELCRILFDVYVIIPEYMTSLDCLVEESVVNVRKEYSKVNYIKIDINAYEGSAIDIGDYVSCFVVDNDGNFVDWLSFYGQIEGKEVKSGRYTFDGYGLMNILAKKYIDKSYSNVSVLSIITEILNEQFGWMQDDWQLIVESSAQNNDIVLERVYLNGSLFDVINNLMKGIFVFIEEGGMGVRIKAIGGRKNQTIINNKFGVITNVIEKVDNVCNVVYFEFENVGFTRVNTFVGNGSTKEFNLTDTPSEPYEVRINGSLIASTAYVINPKDKKILFNTAPANGANIEVKYTYRATYVMRLRNDESVLKYGVVERKVVGKYARDLSIARKLASLYLNMYSEPYTEVELRTDLNNVVDNDIRLGDKIDARIDEIGVYDELFVKRIEVDSRGVARCLFGDEVFDIISWYEEIRKRVENLEKEARDKIFQDSISFSNILRIKCSDSVKVEVSEVVVGEFSGVLGAFIKGVGAIGVGG